jgi:REP element-mobilizing transposase RayT
MTERFRNRYRVPSTRLQTWDYATHAAYFITICTAGHEPYFGEIIHQIMQLSTLGKIVESEWLKTPDLRPDMNLILDNFVVMSDHFHAIIIIGQNEYNRDGDINTGRGTDDNQPDVNRRDAMHGVSTTPGKFGPQRKNLGSIVRGFKSSVTTYARKNDIPFGWQERFYDRIIRDGQEFERISNYIESNPENWKDTNNDLSCE